jgi:hypothetical protein
MRKALGVIILILFLAVVVYFLFYSYNGKGRLSSINFTSGEFQDKIISIKEIDSLTAALNYNFTIKNRIVHTVNPDSVKIPLKPEKPSG